MDADPPQWPAWRRWLGRGLLVVVCGHFAIDMATWAIVPDLPPPRDVKALAFAAIDRGDLAEAMSLASDLGWHRLNLHSGQKASAWHYRNLIEGRVALKRGDVEGAEQHLMEACNIGGDPALDSFGPNMVLADELLAAGRSDTVVAYLHECLDFWDMGDEKVETWTGAIERGERPDFGANLVY